MKRLMFVLAMMMVVMVIGCNKSTKPTKATQADTLIGKWQVVDESNGDMAVVIVFGDDGMMSMGMLENGELKMFDDEAANPKYTVDHNAKQFTIYELSGEVEDVVNFEFISSEKIKTTDTKGKVIYLRRFK